MTETAARSRNAAAHVGLVAGILSIPAFVFALDIAAWVLALVGLVAMLALFLTRPLRS